MKTGVVVEIETFLPSELYGRQNQKFNDKSSVFDHGELEENVPRRLRLPEMEI